MVSILCIHRVSGCWLLYRHDRCSYVGTHVCGCASVYVRVWVYVSESVDIATTYIQLPSIILLASNCEISTSPSTSETVVHVVYSVQHYPQAWPHLPSLQGLVSEEDSQG